MTNISAESFSKDWSKASYHAPAASKNVRAERRRANFRNHVVKPIAKVVIASTVLSTGAGAAVAGAEGARAVQNEWNYTHADVPQPSIYSEHSEIKLGETVKIHGKAKTLDSLTAIAQAADLPDHEWHKTRDMLIDQVHKEGYADADVLPTDLTLELPYDSKIGDHYTGE